MRKRMLAILLAVMMIISLLPTTAFAAGSITELRLMQGDSVTLDMLTNSGGTADLDVGTTYTLSMQLDHPSTLTITLPEGMKFVSLDEETLKDSYSAVTDVTWQKGASVYGYRPNNGTLTVQFDPGTESTPFSVLVQPDEGLIPYEEVEDGYAINTAIKVELDGTVRTMNAVASIASVASNLTAVNVPESRSGVIGDTVRLSGNFLLGRITENSPGRAMKELTLTFTAPSTITKIEGIESSGWTVTKGSTSGSTTTWTAVKQNYFSSSAELGDFRVGIPADASDGATYQISITKVTVAPYGSTQSYDYPISRVRLNIIAMDPDVIHLNLIDRSAVNVFKYDTDNYQTQFGSVRIVNENITDIDIPLTYKLEADTTYQFVTRVSVPCYYSETDDTWMPTKIVVTDEDGKQYTIDGVDNIRAVLSIPFEQRGFAICASDIPGFDTSKSIKAVEVSLPGYPAGYASTAGYDFKQGNVSDTDRAAAWGRIRDTAPDKTVANNTYSVTWDGGNVTQVATTTISTDTNKAQIMVSASAVKFKVDDVPVSGTTVTASAGDVINVEYELGAGNYNAGYHASETILYDPVIYLVQPANILMENVTFTLRGEPLTVSEKKEISPSGLPAGAKMWEYHLTDAEGGKLLVGCYDKDWNTDNIVVNYDLTVLSSISSVSHNLSELVFCKSSLGMKYMATSDAANRLAADTYNLNGGKPMLTVPGTISIQQAAAFEISSAIQIEGEDDYYAFDPENPNGTSAVFARNDTANIKVTVTNYSGYSADHVEVYIPVPKVKDNGIFSDAFKSGDFGFDMYAEGVEGAVPDGWKVEYATVSSISGDPSTGLTFNVDAWETTPSNTDNMIKLSLNTDSNATMPNATSEEFVLKFRASDIEEQMDQRNLFKSWWSFSAQETVSMYDSSKVYNFGTIVQNGILTGTVYGDTNRNSQKDDGESGMAGVTLEAEDQFGRIYTVTTGPDGTYEFDNLPARARWRLR